MDEASSREEYNRLIDAMRGSISVGYDVEKDDPNIGYDMPPEAEIAWLAGWLISEGWTRNR